MIRIIKKPLFQWKVFKCTVLKYAVLVFVVLPYTAVGQNSECQGRVSITLNGEKLNVTFGNNEEALAFANFLRYTYPTSSISVQPVDTPECGKPETFIPSVTDSKPLLVVPRENYQDLVRGPIGSPVTGFCKNGASETVIVGQSDTLCGEPLRFDITKGRIIKAEPPLIPSGRNGDLILLGSGVYSATVDCEGRSVAWCARSGVSILGRGARIESSIDCGVDSLNNVTVAGLQFDGVKGFSCSRGVGRKTNIRLVNNSVINASSRNSGAFGEFSRTVNLQILGNHSRNTGIPGNNNAHSIYHGGRGKNIAVEIAYNLLEDHEGGRCIQIYGHEAKESMQHLYVHDNHAKNCNGNAAILISHTDGRGGPPDNRTWIDSVRVDNNVCENNRIQFRGANLNGGDDWTADGNACDIHSTMGGADPVIVTNNQGRVTGNTR